MCRSYKELMARCNELGMGENRALRKSEKTIENLKKMKVSYGRSMLLMYTQVLWASSVTDPFI